jgi:acetyl-CoA decarbonylase/synthase complex subunit gamma
LYAVGSPDARSEVVVTANYKLTFDIVRHALVGHSVWLLVLGTRGINVWCAAGKGTFGTAELVHRLAAVKLDHIVSHRRLILPQLGAPGVAAHRVQKETGFRVVYGPIEIRDLAAFLAAQYTATPAMRRKTFTVRERLVLIPVELVGALKIVLLGAALFVLVSGLSGPGTFWANASGRGLFAALALACSAIGGAALVPALLPWLPGRAFSAKGLVVGSIVALALVGGVLGRPATAAQWLDAAAWLVIVPALHSFAAMNFTGASTFTSLSGVKKEMRYAVPLQVGAFGAGTLAWLTACFFI